MKGKRDMTVFELKGILNEAIERGCGELPVIATINYDASTEIQDCAYGDVELARQPEVGRVFAISAIKGAFPEAIEARERAMRG